MKADSTKKQNRVIMHVDMDAFFASVEQRDRPELRGRPIAVVGRKRRGVISAASYEARKFGVRSAMPPAQGLRLCPSMILVQGRHGVYVEESGKLKEIFQSFTPLTEMASIDEAYLDMTASVRALGAPYEIAVAVKRRVARNLGLTCSVGVAPNKLLAKLGSSINKPDGVFEILPDHVAEFLNDLFIGKIPGIGPRMASRLNDLGVETVGHLAAIPLGLLERRFGNWGQWLYRVSRGMDDRPVRPPGQSRMAKSVGNSVTLEYDERNPAELERIMCRLCRKVGRRARKHGLAGKTVALTIRYADFTTFSRRVTLQSAVADDLSLIGSARQVFSAIRLTAPVRLMGVTLSGLSPGPGQMPLFISDRRRLSAQAATDRVNERFGFETVVPASLL